MTFLWMALGLLWVSCGGGNTRQPLTIAVAANMQYAMEALAEDFTETTGIPCELVVSSSGKLTAQIREGAPFHILVSADMKYPEELYKSGLTTGPPQVYAYGKLVLWSLQDEQVPSLEMLQEARVRHVAVPNPVTAPYGKAALEVLDNTGSYEVIQEKLVYGESIAQTNQFISSRAADIGFTALSVVVAPQLKGQGQWVELDPALYSPIAQGVVVLRNPDEIQKAALAFRDYLFAVSAREILLKFGYSVDE